jgi:hypothetical protein
MQTASDNFWGANFAPRYQTVRVLPKTPRAVIIAAMRETGIGPKGLSRAVKAELLSHCNSFIYRATNAEFEAFSASLVKAARARA